MQTLAPAPPALEQLGALWRGGDPLPTWLDWRGRFGSVLRLGPRRGGFHLVMGREEASQVLRTRKDEFTRLNQAVRLLALVQGQGLATVDGDEWRSQRRRLQPLFHGRSVAAYGPDMLRVIRAAFAEWDQRGAEFELDCSVELMRLTLRIGSVTMSGQDLDPRERAELEQAGEAAQEWLAAALRFPLRPPLWVPTPGNRRFQAAIELFRQNARRLLRERREGKGEGNQDLVQLLLDSRDPETGAPLTDTQLVDQLITVAGAGQDTTALALGWTLERLAHEPEIQAEVAAEVDGLFAAGPFEPADLEGLDLTTRVLEESLRLRPPIYAVGRTAREALVLGGFAIPAGGLVLVALYGVHHDPEDWPDPSRFDPDRFLPDAKAARPAEAWCPFGLGPHRCIGERFALDDTRFVLVELLSRWQVLPARQDLTPLAPTMTLRPAEPIRLRLRRRG